MTTRPASLLLVISSIILISDSSTYHADPFLIPAQQSKISRQISTSMSSEKRPGEEPAEPASTSAGDGKFHFAIDRGGTFTDVHCTLPTGVQLVTKLLSEDPANYPDAPTEGIRRLLHEHDATRNYQRGEKVDTANIGSIRMGTTVATNALLERDGERMGLLITKGFGDLLEIGNQSRPDIFDLSCAKPGLLYEDVAEVEERVMLAGYCDEGRSADEIAALEKEEEGGVADVVETDAERIVCVYVRAIVDERVDARRCFSTLSPSPPPPPPTDDVTRGLIDTILKHQAQRLGSSGGPEAEAPLDDQVHITAIGTPPNQVVARVQHDDPALCDGRWEAQPCCLLACVYAC